MRSVLLVVAQRSLLPGRTAVRSTLQRRGAVLHASCSLFTPKRTWLSSSFYEEMNVPRAVLSGDAASQRPFMVRAVLPTYFANPHLQGDEEHVQFLRQQEREQQRAKRSSVLLRSIALAEEFGFPLIEPSISEEEEEMRGVVEEYRDRGGDIVGQEEAKDQALRSNLFMLERGINVLSIKQLVPELIGKRKKGKRAREEKREMQEKSMAGEAVRIPNAVSSDFKKLNSTLPTRKSPLVKSIMCKGIALEDLRVLDCTAGLGRDTFLMASAGATVHAVERNVAVYSAVRDGIERAVQLGVGSDRGVMDRISLSPYPAEAHDVLHALEVMRDDELRPHVIVCADPLCCDSRDLELKVSILTMYQYVDPMHPDKSRRSRALPRVGMQLTRAMIGRRDLEDEVELLALALEVAQCKVVVKRPYYAFDDVSKHLGVMPEQGPKGRALRFEVYNVAQ